MSLRIGIRVTFDAMIERTGVPASTEVRFRKNRSTKAVQYGSGMDVVLPLKKGVRGLSA